MHQPVLPRTGLMSDTSCVLTCLPSFLFLFVNIVGAEYIVCTHCQIIVGAAAPTEPMVPTLMVVPLIEYDELMKFRLSYFQRFALRRIQIQFPVGRPLRHRI